MKMRSFYKIYRKKPDTYKLKLLCDNIENMMRNRYEASNLRWNGGSAESIEYYDHEAQAMQERCRWLYAELYNVLEQKGE